MKPLNRILKSMSLAIFCCAGLMFSISCYGLDNNVSGAGPVQRHRRPPLPHRFEPEASAESRSSEFQKRRVPIMDSVANWALILNDVDPKKVRECVADTIVMDATRDGKLSTMFSRDDITYMKNTKPKKLIAYLSIGEAEDFRGYLTTGSVAWLGQENPRYPGDFQVNYWDEKWQNILFGSQSSYLDRIMEAGFDGVFLDKVDSWEAARENGRRGAETDMVQLISRIAVYANSKNPDFVVVPNNAEPLVRLGLSPSVSALLVEDLLFREHSDGEILDVEPQPQAETARRLIDLRSARQGNLVILDVEYLLDRHSQAAFIPQAQAFMRNEGFKLHVADRDSQFLHCDQ